MAAPDGWVRVQDIARAGLTADQVIHLMAMALEELGVIRGLILVHGVERGTDRYVEAGGHMRFSDDGEPILPLWAAGEKRRTA
jgi:hypothetical protein